MRSEKSQDKTPKRSKKSMPSVAIDVAPGNGKLRRLVVARCGDLPEFTHRIDPFSASARNGFVVELAKAWGIDDPDDVKEVKDLIPRRAQEVDDLVQKAAREAADEAASAGKDDPSARALEETPQEVITAAEAFLKNADMMQELADDLAKLGIAGETRLAQTEYLIGTSRLLEKPLGGSVKSSTSSGKSYVTENVVSLMPPEGVLIATDISAQALYYMQDPLSHMLVCVGERKHASAGNEADAANATLALREMMSRGRLDKYVTVSTDDGLATRHVVQEGPIAYLETTTQQEIFEEDATRMLSLATDESPEHTAVIMALQARQAAWETETADELEAIRRKHQTAQRLLKPMRVRIPYATRLALPSTRLVARRAFPQLLAFIEAVALLRQHQKTVHADGHIDADVEDYATAYDLMLPVLGRTFAPLGARAEKLLLAIQEQDLAPETIFTRTDCQRWAGVGPTEVRNRLTILVEAGMAEQLAGGKGVRYEYKLIITRSGSTPARDRLGLITPADLRKQLKKKKKSGASTRKKCQPNVNPRRQKP